MVLITAPFASHSPSIMDFNWKWTRPRPTSHLKILPKKTLGKKKRREQRTHYSSFSSLDMWTFVIRGWAEEAEALGLTGPSFRPLLRHLFVLFLHKTKRAFNPKSSLGPRPIYRDVQVEITGRRKIWLNFGQDKRKSNLRKDDLETPSSKLRKKGWQQRAFLKSFISEEEDETTLDGISSDAAGSEDPLRGEDPELFNFRNKMFKDSWSLAKDNKKDLSAEHITLIKIFGLFTLALLAQNQSTVTLGDIVHFAESGSLSLKDAYVHLHPSMILQGNFDIGMFNTHARSYKELYLTLRNKTSCLIHLLNVGPIEFGTPMSFRRKCGVPLLIRYLKELALPKALHRTIYIVFQHTHFLEELKSSWKVPLPDVSLRVLAALLVTLKFIYGLDDFTEDVISWNMRNLNKRLHKHKKRFVLEDWIRFSRFRILLLMRASSVFHRKFHSLLPRTRMSVSADITEIKEACERRRKRKKSQHLL
eukprot:TRINITY_DN2433_c0_g1_i1.p1 TRINITY_DN2433_c0_g1~~TRINITY_DN2433_c0_g1_i1.p1  ORF type:complete len:476 (+),score=86.09 TRINITY_DN2433_c0_g1_i1:520-1947(+)